MVNYFLIILFMESLFIIWYKCLRWIKISNTTLLYMEVADLWYMDFVSFGNYANFVAKKWITIVCRCLLKTLKVHDFVWHVHISNKWSLLSILFFTTQYKIYPYWNVFWKQENLEITKALYLSIPWGNGMVGLPLFGHIN
jgi:hypothetical protein